MRPSIVTHLARPYTASRGAAPSTSYWVGASRAELAQRIAERRTQQESAYPSDFVYGPMRSAEGGSPMAQYRRRQRWQARRARRVA